MISRLTADRLVQPLAKVLANDRKDWKVDLVWESEATKDRLRALVSKDGPPLLLAAGLGLGFASGHEHQPSRQGAIICQGWPETTGEPAEVSTDFFFGGGDLAADACLLGMIAFLSMARSAGTPRLDDYPRLDGLRDGTFRRAELAPKAFLSDLSRKLLSHPEGGMLAVIGHVERLSDYPLQRDRGRKNLETYASVLERLLAGERVGRATEPFNDRYVELATELSNELEQTLLGDVLDTQKLEEVWALSNDARNFIVLGDPAVRLRAAEV